MTPRNTLRVGVALRSRPPCMISLAHRRVSFQGVGSYRAGWDVVARAGPPSDVFVLDFEGVLVDNQTQGFAGLKELLANCEYPFYVASAGAADTVSSAASEQLGLPLGADSPRLFAGLQPAADKKAGCLKEIGERPICKETKAKLHFIDDEPDVLRAVAEDAELKGRWKLYLAAWGDDSEGRAKAAKALPGVSVLSLKDFQELLKWGVLMGVDDGCEPTPEEVMEGVTGDLPSRS